MTSANRAIVSNEKDITDSANGEGTLRKAIQMANEFYENTENSVETPFFIDFRSEDGSTSIWNIKPEIPLPPLLKGNIFVNYNLPQFVIINGEKLSKSRPKSVPSWVSEPKGAKQNQKSSLLTLGNGEWVNDPAIPPEFKDSKFYLKGVNFSSNVAKGEDGHDGGGGGLGAGGGLSVVSGTAIIEDAVFQNLKAQGGEGIGPGAGGGHGAVGDNRNGSAGQQGGSGGLRGSFTLGKGSSISPCEGGRAGNRGDKDHGWQMGQEGHSAAEIRENHRHGLAGEDAPPAPSCGFSSLTSESAAFGNGGGGGGGGGGGSRYKPFFEDANNGNGGDGGNGAMGGYGAGNGGGGGGGQNGDPNSQHGNAGIRGRAGISETLTSPFGSRGAKGEPGSFGIGVGHAPGGRGGHGAALGGAIAVLSNHAAVELYNVDFINTNAEAKGKSQDINILFSRRATAGTGQGQVVGDGIRIYESSEDQGFRKPDYNKTIKNEDFHAFISDSASPPPDEISFLHELASFPRNDLLAKIRNQHVDLKPGNIENIAIRFAGPSSGIIDLDIDQSKLVEELNQVHRDLIPVEEEETIKGRLKTKLVSAAIELGGGVTGQTIPTDMFSASSKILNRNPYGAHLDSMIQFASSIITANQEYREEVKKNNANIKKLAERTNPDRKLIEIPKIDISKARTLVTINNFTIGEDIIYLDDFGKKTDPDKAGSSGPIIRAGASGVSNSADGNELTESFEIHLSNDNNVSDQTRIATVSLDKKSISGLNSGLQRSPEAYLRSLLNYNPDTNRWIIGSTLINPVRIIQRAGSDYFGGPAGEVVILEREAGLQNLETVKVRTQHYDDKIYGTPGNENVFTHFGEDQIFPGLGIDTINAGDGFDLVNYQDLKKPINVIGDKADDINVEDEDQSPVHQVTLIETETNTTLNTSLFNAEAISAFGPSMFDLRKLSNPNELSDINTKNKSKGYFAVRTGSGSTVEGSDHSDTIVISLRNRENENPSDFLLDLSNCQNKKLKALSNPSKVVGGSADDQLIFMIDAKSSNKLLTEHNLEIADIKTSSGELSQYKAIISNNIIISFVKDVEVVKAYMTTGDGEDAVEISAQTSEPIDENKMTCSSEEVAALFKSIKEETPTNTLDVGYTADADGFFFLVANEPDDTIDQPDDNSGIDGPGNILGSMSEGEIFDWILADPSTEDNFFSADSPKKDKVTGTPQNDILLIGPGKDKLIGKAGADIFWAWDSESFIKKSIDTLIDFRPSEGDRIVLDDINQDFPNLSRNPKFTSIASREEFKKAVASDNEIIYLQRRNKGNLYFNENLEESGFGEGGLFLKIKGGIDLSASNLFVYQDIPLLVNIEDEVVAVE